MQVGSHRTCIGNVIHMHLVLFVYMYHFTCRLQLAALHFNENANRKQAVTKGGEERYDIIFPKYKKGGYIVRKVVQIPTYGRFSMHLSILC